MRVIFTFLVLTICACLSLTAREPNAPPQPKPADKSSKQEPVEGRKTKKIEGFTFLISDEALKADHSQYERPPLAVLEYECQQLAKMLSPKAVNLLRRLTIFVDWDAEVSLANGRSGRALASYYGGSARQMMREGKHPLQAKTVTIHSLKSLTSQRQPKNDARSSSLLLHEFAHAVHDQLFGFDHAGIKLAYEQAMERQLYEKDSYAATNAREFFAEVTCAYLDRLRYYPYTRTDLKKHDPVTYKVMESLWNGAASRGSKTARPYSEKVNLAVTLPKDIKLGKAIAGPTVVPEKLAGKVVLIGYWGGEFTNVLNRLQHLQNELGDYGLVTIGAHAYTQPERTTKAKAEERAPLVAVVQNTFVREEAGPIMKSQLGGHAIVFGPDGKCVYRGSAYDADDAVRAVIGKLLLTSSLDSKEMPKAFKPIADAFATGATPVSVIPRLASLKGSSDENTKNAAMKLTDLILAPGQKALENAQFTAKTDPVAAFLMAEQVATQFKNTPLAQKATTLVAGLRVNQAVTAELKARVMVNQIEQVGRKLRGQEGSFSPGDSAFQAKNRSTLDQLKTLMEQLRKNHPMAHARVTAEKIAREFEIP